MKKKQTPKSKTPSKDIRVSADVKPSSKDFSQFKQALHLIRKRIAGGLEHIEQESLNKSQRDAAGDLSGYSLHMADVATDNFDMEFNINLASNEQQYLNLIDSALKKIDEGTYGSCEDCSKVIPQKRLLAVPFARLCIACQELEEKKSRRG